MSGIAHLSRARPAPALVTLIASAGGLCSVREILRRLPAGFPVPIVVFQHLAPDAPSTLAELLAASSELRVEWAADGSALLAGTVYVVRPGYVPMLDVVGRYREAKRTGRERRWGATDWLQNLATTLGPSAIAVILTGSGTDGVRGALAVRAAGGIVLAQEASTCSMPYLPIAAMAVRAPHLVLPPKEIAATLNALASSTGAAEHLMGA